MNKSFNPYQKLVKNLINTLNYIVTVDKNHITLKNITGEQN
jgi:hypothetical protein